jgi:WhiB family redox-sensing transcriptional regulator
MTTPGDNCLNCLRLTRPYGEPSTSWPGTVTYGSKGYCTTCSSHYREHGTFEDWAPGPRRGPGLNGATGPRVRIFLTHQAWTANALCAQTDPETFYPDQGQPTQPAKAVCLSCPVRAECLEYALVNKEPFGVWGGLSERERRSLLRKRAA